MIVGSIDGKKLSIEQMRSIREFCNKTASGEIDNKIVLIDDADNMSIEAYNSLLTLLEEPPAKTVIILIAHSKMSIPKTILSRVQTVNFYPPSSNQLEEIIKKSGLDKNIPSYILSTPAKIHSYSSREDELNNLYNNANEFITGDLTKRLMIISFIKEKTDAADFMSIMASIMENVANTEDWSNRSESLILAQSHLYNNGNAKLVLENLAQEF